MNAPQHSADAVLKPSDNTMIKDYPIVKGPDLDDPKVTLDSIFDNYLTIGYSASSLGKAMNEVNRMLQYRLSDDKVDPNSAYPTDTALRSKIPAKIFLGYTSNLVSSGLRELICYLVKHKLVDVIVTTAGAIEEDLIKCLAPTYLGEFNLDGAKLRDQSLNRIGDLIVPNDNYCLFEDWILPIFDDCYERQQRGYHWTPSRLINRLGEVINDTSSIAYWAHKNNIPIFCPALTDGSLGDMLYFHSYKRPGLVLDVVGDIRAMNNQAIFSPKNGCLILGGGVCKHHIMNANLFTGRGADYSVFVNTAQEFDGSDAGAKPDEAVSWGKISADAKPVKVHCDATLVFPIIVKKCFQVEYEKNKEMYDNKIYGDAHEMYCTRLDQEAGWKPVE